MGETNYRAVNAIRDTDNAGMQLLRFEARRIPWILVFDQCFEDQNPTFADCLISTIKLWESCGTVTLVSLPVHSKPCYFFSIPLCMDLVLFGVYNLGITFIFPTTSHINAYNLQIPKLIICCILKNGIVCFNTDHFLLFTLFFLLCDCHN